MIVHELKNEAAAYSFFDHSTRIIDWVADDNFRIETIEKIKVRTNLSFTIELTQTINEKIIKHYSEISDILPKTFLTSFRKYLK